MTWTSNLTVMPRQRRWYTPTQRSDGSCNPRPPQLLASCSWQLSTMLPAETFERKNVS